MSDARQLDIEGNNQPSIPNTPPKARERRSSGPGLHIRQQPDLAAIGAVGEVPAHVAEAVETAAELLVKNTADQAATRARLAVLAGGKRAVLLAGDREKSKAFYDEVRLEEETLAALEDAGEELEVALKAAQRAHKVAVGVARSAAARRVWDALCAELVEVCRPASERLAVFYGQWAEGEALIQSVNEENAALGIDRVPSLEMARTRTVRIRRQPDVVRVATLDRANGDREIDRDNFGGDLGQMMSDGSSRYVTKDVVVSWKEVEERVGATPLLDRVCLPDAVETWDRQYLVMPRRTGAWVY